ncbi:MAG: hypothetical protein RR061_06220 [Muribaculaceae bacterium]
MKKKTAVSFGDNTLNFYLPTSWGELTQEQLRIVLTCLTTYDYEVAKVATFCKLCNVKIIRNINDKTYICRVKKSDGSLVQFCLSANAMTDILLNLDWIDMFGYIPTRIEYIGKNKATDAKLHGVPFGDYLLCENYYQGFLESQDDKAIISIANILYKADLKALSAVEKYSTTMWFATVKLMFAMTFTHFFKKSEVISEEHNNMLEVMNAQIRSLTGGDITKEEKVFEMDCWRALTELDAKAREADEYNSKIKK